MKMNPAVKAKANKRIKATDGHAILEHFFMANADEGSLLLIKFIYICIQ